MQSKRITLVIVRPNPYCIKLYIPKGIKYNTDYQIMVQMRWNQFVF